MNPFADARRHWQLDPEIDFFNHGSFGATPKCVLQTQRQFQDQLEREPIRFLAPERELEPKIDVVRDIVGKLVNAQQQDLAFVRNATDGVNAVLRSFPFRAGDEIVISNHGYNACNNAAQFAAERAGAKLRIAAIPFPLADPIEILEAITAAFSAETRLLLIDHVTSPTALVLPIKQIIEAAHSRGIRVLVDGAHAPGMVEVDLEALDADYYTANHHKWLCAPKVSGFLWVRPELQNEIRPTIISHGANRRRPGRSRFLSEFDWTGTFDPTPLLAVPAAIEFLARLSGSEDHYDIRAHMRLIRELTLDARACLLDRLAVEPPAPAEMIGTMLTLPLPAAANPNPAMIDPLQRRLFERYRFELPVFNEPNLAVRCLRISIQAYNDLDQLERLAQALKTELAAEV